jgi:hypothetical protein
MTRDSLLDAVQVFVAELLEFLLGRYVVVYHDFLHVKVGFDSGTDDSLEGDIQGCPSGWRMSEMV